MNATDGAALDVEALTRLRFFSGESPAALEWLVDCCARRALAEGEVLLSPGQDNKNLYVVLSGFLHVRLKPDGPPISTLVAGDCIGEMSILDHTHTSAWVSAASETRLLVLEESQVWTLITRSHSVAVNLLSILSSRVRRDHGIIELSQQLQDFYEYHARIDALTGLHNRRWLEAALKRHTQRSRGASRPLSIVMTDIDSFKQYNDSNGHLSGDAALRTVANVVMAQVRPNDIAARFGGEEFVVVLPDTVLASAIAIAQRLCDAVREQPVVGSDGEPLPGVTVSAGVATTSDHAEAEALLAAADAALYRAKNLGRDCVSS